jgi:hypothetical protein
MEIDNLTLRGLLQSEVPRLSDYSIGFVRLITVSGTPDADLGGSGTLVTIDKVHGILTASHVITSLQKREYVGLVLPEIRRGHFRLARRSVRAPTTE